MIIMADDISKVATALEIAKKTFSVATLSIIIGLGLSLVLMGVFATGMINAIYGALLHALIDISVIIYALRARTIQLRGEIKTKP